ncbi:MAG TPA: hypothetical protein VMR45_04215 [Patescibacteria group bacterium]|nr:hypothetical protein [Patescibacteria group bacterium]
MPENYHEPLLEIPEGKEPALRNEWATLLPHIIFDKGNLPDGWIYSRHGAYSGHDGLQMEEYYPDEPYGGGKPILGPEAFPELKYLVPPELDGLPDRATAAFDAISALVASGELKIDLGISDAPDATQEDNGEQQ